MPRGRGGEVLVAVRLMLATLKPHTIHESKNTGKDLEAEAFLRDVLRHCAVLFHTAARRNTYITLERHG